MSVVLPLRLARRARLFLLSFVLALSACVVLSGDARAEGAPILLVLHGDELPRERLRAAIAKELAKPVALSSGGESGASGIVTVTYRKAEGELAVTWDGSRRGTVTRVVPARVKADDIVGDVAILAGNLARDEADELLGPPAPLPAAPLPALPPDATEPRPAPPVAERAPRRRDPSQEDFTVSLFYPLASNNGRPWVRTNFDFNVFHGRVGQLEGVQIGGFGVVAPDQGKGSGNVEGLQLSWLVSAATGHVTGSQISSVVNVSGPLTGWQTAFAVNVAAGDVSGSQQSLGLNVATGTLRGVQVASLNVARDLRGLQVGALNIGRKIDGVMLGLVNVADDIDGAPIGLVSVTKTGGIHPAAWASSATFANVGVKFATKYTYTMPSAHYHRAYDRDFVGAGFTIGGHIPIGEGPYVDTDLSFAWLAAPERSAQTLASGDVDSYHEHLLQPRLRMLFGYAAAAHFKLFAGPALIGQIRLEREGKEATIRIGPEFVAGVEL